VKRERNNRLIRTLFPLALLTICHSIAQAGSFTGTIIGVFSNPVLAGNVLNDPAVGQLAYMDNTSTAVTGTATSGGSACAGSNTLCWGLSTSGVAANQSYSELVFAGTAGYNGSGKIGTITFLNGTSDLDTLIFGGTLSFYENTVSPATFVGSDNVIISTTSNQYSGTGLTQAQLQTDADYINICGNTSNICNSSIEAYEDSEGGTSLTVDLSATLVGDPTLVLNGVTVDPLTAPGTGGVVGSLAPLGAVPEPSTVTLTLAAVFILGIGSVRQRALFQKD
jgi:hypothetical protein